MQQFPVLRENQVVLMRAEFNTGHILDENLNLALHDGQIVYTIFDSIDTALAAAENIVKNGTIECVIYTKDRELVKYVTPKN
ncbi:hypothetical protein [Puia dinghuensis]|uniref:hypothetical protein n=1 Tax=Puia dinghuensis TaxID=1792502 RepID=UPI00166F5DF7|nr:hypothetical protein [Puia dinghuensis]